MLRGDSRNARFCRLTIKPSKKLQRELRETVETREFFCETCPEPVEGFAQFALFALEKSLNRDCSMNLDKSNILQFAWFFFSARVAK